MTERIRLQQAEQAATGTTEYEIEAIIINIKASFISVYVVSPDNNFRRQFRYENIPQIIQNLMTRNYQVESLPTVLLKKIAKDEYRDEASVITT